MRWVAGFVGALGRARSLGSALVVGSALLGASASNVIAQPPADLPPPASRPVDFSTDIEPVLRASCIRCHARGQARGGFSLESREALLRGGDGGPAVVPGNSEESLLLALVAGLDPDNVMPQKGARLTREQVSVLRAWIDQGVAWPAGVSFARSAPRNLEPKRPSLPPGPADANPVDRLLARYLADRKVALRSVDDRTFARRVYLDAVGLLPTPEQLQAFVSDRRPDKRTRLVNELLARGEAPPPAHRVRFADHWISFWNDLLRNDYRGPGYIDGGRTQITAWLYPALSGQVPYDQFVRQLVDPVAGAEGFTKGIVWRGVVNASQSPPMQAAQNVSQVFMGVNLKCASCHDSFVNEWQLADAYGLAGVFADRALEMVECDRPTGRTARVRFIYPSLGHIEGDASRSARVTQLASLMTSRSNGRLPRTIVNRLWQRFMGHGLVEPVDDMEQPSWHPDLLDWLADDLVASGYDLPATMARILTSRAYQAVAVDEPDGGTYAFRGPLVRRLSAEQFADALSVVTGAWPYTPDKVFDTIPREGGLPRAALAPSDALMTALGRPNREQVVTTRVTSATTLQALELANGETLARWLRQGAERLAAERTWRPAQLVDRVYARSLGRTPTRQEARLALDHLGASPGADAIEDLLWSVAMLPEFQLIH